MRPSVLTLPDTADRNQARASDPTASAWVSASAGTGKTEVLVRRALRLLLAGSKPEKILCLTYTKTAAAEMQNRLLKELAAWATVSTADLRGKLAKLFGREPEARDIAAARRLFAQTLEARGGLKIYTLHGFCERLLQRFPLEAGVAPNFAVLGEAEAILLRRQAFDATVASAALDREGPIGQALAKIIAVAGEEHFRQMVDAVLEKRAELSALTALHDGDPDWPEAEHKALKRAFGLTDEDSEAALTDALAAVLGDADIEALIAALDDQECNKTDAALREALRAARYASGFDRAEALKPIFLKQNLEPRARLCSKDFEQAAPSLSARLDAAQSRYVRLHTKRAELLCAEASGALLLLADRVQSAYTSAKRAEAVLDYDDLILKARDLLSRAGAAAWVLYKIDGGIDHILVDEAQDTNPEQWSIIEKLAEEFFAGLGASDRLRTLFAVGDEKQSIYSFQGADPARFGAIGRAFRARAEAAELGWHQVPLTLSFRSTEPVLEAVDAVFARAPAREGVTWQEAGIVHHAFRGGEPGLVELWPIETETKPEPAPAFEPWNEKAATARAVDLLCQRLARTIKGWLAHGEVLASESRKVTPGDILILVRRRDPFTTPMIRALKLAGVPVAGADRMRLTEQLAVKDLMALADVLLMPEDDLALAVVLKSPLFGLDDGALFDLAYERRGSLWTELKEKAKGDARFAEAAAKLSFWFSRADLSPPYEFFLELLAADGQEMRRRLLTRLGPEAAEALDEFLDLALSFDRQAAPSLQGFIHGLRASEIEIKRDMEQARDEVRIMTVHGAKGLQAPIVFLPDTCMNPRKHGSKLHAVPRQGPPGQVGHLVWGPGGVSIDAIDEAKALARRAESDEYHRLLYVAMTRARDRLYICGWSNKDEPDEGSWYDLVRQGLRGLLSEARNEDGASVQRLETRKPRPARPMAETRGEPEAEVAKLPEWALTVAREERPRATLAPSRVGPSTGSAGGQPPLGPRALAENKRFSRGRLVHALLQYLPEVAPAEQERAARRFVARRGRDLAQAMREEIVSETLRLVGDARFAPLFAPGSLGEVPVVARIGDGRDALELSGQIDRLAILGDALLVLDYKTNRPPPSEPTEVAEAYIAQLASYRLALRAMFPGRTLRAAIVWTDGPKLMEIPSTLLDEAERRILGSDRQP